MRFYGQFDPPVDKILHDSYFAGVRNGVFLEAGAFTGIEESSCLVFEESLGWTGLNVEPSPFNFDLLQQNRPGSVNVQAALSDSEGTATFTNVLHPTRGANFGNGSLSHMPGHRAELVADGCSFETFEVRTMRYDTLLAQHGIDQVDLFVLDVEGHELSVLRGMRGTTVWPRVMCVEYGNLGVDALDAMLLPEGYVRDGIAFNNAYYSLGGLAPTG